MIILHLTGSDGTICILYRHNGSFQQIRQCRILQQSVPIRDRIVLNLQVRGPSAVICDIYVRRLGACINIVSRIHGILEGSALYGLRGNGSDKVQHRRCRGRISFLRLECIGFNRQVGRVNKKHILQIIAALESLCPDFRQ